MNRPILSVLVCGLCAAASAQELQIDKGIVTPASSLKVVLKLKAPMNGAGELLLTWTDCFGRTVLTETRKVQVAGDALPLELPLNRAVGLANYLQAELKVGEQTATAPKAEFIVTPENPKWDDYQIVMYFAYKTAEQQMALRSCGITAGKISSGGTQRPDGGKTWYANGYRFYCDQIQVPFLAAYHTPSLNPKHKALLDAKELYKQDRAKKDALMRKPCFFDDKARAQSMDAMKKAVANQMRYKPFMYATDECGVADLVTAWDFCFCEPTLQRMRQWLVQQYGSLEGINKQWGTDFKKLEEVVPLSTDEMMARGGENLSQWADHRAFMNKVFADAVKESADTAHAVDPAALMGLVGCQMPSAFGGYDYWLLSQAMDAVEPYNIGNNREIWRSLAPTKPAWTTAFGFGNMEVWRLWYQALHGDRGIIIYDEKSSYLTPQGEPTPMARQIAPTYRELTGGVVKQLLAMNAVNDPVAIHYSHPSITAHWMFEARPEGKGWLNRGSAAERKNSDFLRLRESTIRLIEDNVRQYTFVSYGQMESGEFDKSDAKVLFLPQSVAMSQKECESVRRFVQRGGTVIADCRTALMDGHCKTLDKGQLDDLFGIERAEVGAAPASAPVVYAPTPPVPPAPGAKPAVSAKPVVRDLRFAPGAPGLKPTPAVSNLTMWRSPPELANVPAAEPAIRVVGDAVARYQDAKGTPTFIVREHPNKGMTIYLNAVVTDYHRWRLRPPEGDALRLAMADVLKAAGVTGQLTLTRTDDKPLSGVEAFTFKSGELRLVGVHRNYQLRVNELGPPEYQKQDALEGDLELKAEFPAEMAVYDQRQGKYLGKKKSVTFPLSKYEPMILTVLPEPVGALTVQAPAEVKLGEIIEAKLALAAPKPADNHIFRVRLVSGDGLEVTALTRSVVAPRGQVTVRLPIAASDAAGPYTLEVKDMATGVKAVHNVMLKDPKAAAAPAAGK